MSFDGTMGVAEVMLILILKIRVTKTNLAIPAKFETSLFALKFFFSSFCILICIRKIRVLTVIDGLGFGGGESRILSMGQGFDRDRFTHSVLALNPMYYSGKSSTRGGRNTRWPRPGWMISRTPDRSGLGSSMGWVT